MIHGSRLYIYNDITWWFHEINSIFLQGLFFLSHILFPFRGSNLSQFWLNHFRSDAEIAKLFCHPTCGASFYAAWLNRYRSSVTTGRFLVTLGSSLRELCQRDTTSTIRCVYKGFKSRWQSSFSVSPWQWDLLCFHQIENGISVREGATAATDCCYGLLLRTSSGWTIVTRPRSCSRQ